MKIHLGYPSKIPTSLYTPSLKVANSFNIKKLATHITRLASKNREHHALALYSSLTSKTPPEHPVSPKG